MTAHAYAFIF